MKKLLTFLLLALFMIVNVNAEEKVKVYMFEAGGCPYCEKEEEYLKSLDGYGTKFELIKKELYIDHVDWEKGKDYDLGKKVAETFADKGFEDASYEGTPFVVISDIYAAASYNTELESYINKAFEEGDKDAVSCIKDGKSDCVRQNPESLVDLSTDASKTASKGGIVLAVLGGIILIGAIIYVVKNRPNNNDISEEKEDNQELVSEEEKETSKEIEQNTNKTDYKKSINKKTNNKKSNNRKSNNRKSDSKKTSSSRK